MKADLADAWSWQGRIYGPGLSVEIPDKLAIALGLSPELEQGGTAPTPPTEESGTPDSEPIASSQEDEPTEELVPPPTSPPSTTKRRK